MATPRMICCARRTRHSIRRRMPDATAWCWCRLGRDPELKVPALLLFRLVFHVGIARLSSGGGRRLLGFLLRFGFFGGAPHFVVKLLPESVFVSSAHANSLPRNGYARSVCPVAVTTLAHSSADNTFRRTVAIGIGTWMNMPCCSPTMMSVLPDMPACTALRAKESHSTESTVAAGTLRM